jgi:hypothetical protein
MDSEEREKLLLKPAMERLKTFTTPEEAAALGKRIAGIMLKANEDNSWSMLRVSLNRATGPTVVTPEWVQQHSVKDFDKLLTKVDRLVVEFGVGGELLKAFFAAQRQVWVSGSNPAATAGDIDDVRIVGRRTHMPW